MIKFVAGILLLAFTLNVEAKDEKTLEIPSLTLLKVTYCACMCCEQDKQTCVRHQDIPLDFECDDGKCADQFCKYWTDAKCSKDCFCNECKSKMTNDYRCIDFKQMPDSCASVCEKVYDCSSDPAVEEVNQDLVNVIKGSSDESCVIPCYCDVCKSHIPRQIYAECIRTSRPDKACKCDTLDIVCRDDQGKKQHPENDITDEQIDAASMCKLQCFCKKCGKKKGKVRETCRDISKRIPKDCDCGLIEGVVCPTDEELGPQNQENAMCKVSCFCQQCKGDKRMRGMIRDTCEQHSTIPPGCSCDEQEDCDVLDGLASAANQFKKKTEL